MYQRLLTCGIALLGLTVLSVPSARAADNYALDPMHTAANFKISHLGLSWTYGRFNDVSGAFTLDPDDASKCSFELTIKVKSLDTNNVKRDDHLRSPDFFNEVQYPLITFKSTAVKAVKNGYEVTGDLTMHDVKKATTFRLLGGRKAEFPKGVMRTGYSTELMLKRSDFGMDKMKEAIGDEVYIAISFEGVKK
jgi:polyisoprenoid-binding protein YceI